MMLFLDNSSIELLRSFVKTSRVTYLTLYVCGRIDEVSSICKMISDENIIIHVFSPKHSTRSQLNVQYHRMAVFVDLSCKDATQLLKQALIRSLYSRLHHWLLLSNATNTVDLYEDLQHIGFPLDSHVVLANKDKNDQYTLRDVYAIGNSYNTVFIQKLPWKTGEKIPPERSRDNYEGIVLRSGIVVLEDDWKNRMDMRRKHLNTWSKINYALMTLVSQMLNFKMKEFHVSDWGYLNPDGTFTGLVGALQKNEGDIGAVACIITPSRMKAVDYTAETIPFRPRFVFRQPSLSSVANIYILPFTAGVWGTYFGATVLLTILLAFNYKMQKKYESEKYPSPDDDWLEWIICSLAVVCQQGSPRTPNNLSSRIIFMFLLLLSMFFFNSYSAIIVSLLQTPSSSITTLKELVSSPLKLTMHDIVYNYNHNNYINDSVAPLVKKLFKERIYSRRKEDVFLSQERGAELLRRGLFSIHVDMSVYKIIADTWLETEKCDLKEVFMFPAYKFSIPVKKGSPYREHITLRLRLLREVGLINREWEKWVTQKPTCKDSHIGFVSVGLQEFHPALLVILYGILVSSGVLIMERLYHCLVNRENSQKRRKPTTTRKTNQVLRYYN